MMSSKISFVTSYLVVISIIYHVHAMVPFQASPLERCKSLLKSEVFSTDHSERENFSNAFKNLSLDQIDFRFRPPEEIHESTMRKHDREQRCYMVKMYYLDLFIDHGLDLSQCKTPYQWCDERIKEVPLDTEINEDKEGQRSDCYKYTKILLQNDVEVNDPERIFKRLYESWSNVDIDLIGFNTNQYFASPEERELYGIRESYQIETYTKPFFKHYESVLEGVYESPGRFISINDFCSTMGHLLVTSSTR